MLKFDETNEVNIMNEVELRDGLRNYRNNIKSFDELIAFLMNVNESSYRGYTLEPIIISQVALATAYYFDSKYNITGFQAGGVMCEFIKDWLFQDNKCGFSIIDYDNMLYPQYRTKFEKKLTYEQFERIKKEAIILLKDRQLLHPEVKKHLESIVDGIPPFGYVLERSR